VSGQLNEQKPICVDNQGEVLVVRGAAPALAEGTASIEPTSKAERASTAKPKALAPLMQGQARPRPARGQVCCTTMKGPK